MRSKSGSTTSPNMAVTDAAVLSAQTTTASAMGISLAYATLPPELAIQQKPGTEEYRVSARAEISQGTVFGPVVAPYRLVTANQPPTSVFGRFTTKSLETLVFDSNETCNWMKFLRLSRNMSANTEASQCLLTGEIFFSVTKNIPPKSELIVALSPNYCDALTRCIASLSQKWAREGASTTHALRFAASPSDAALIRSVGNELKRMGHSVTMLCERVLQLDHTAWDPMDKLLQRFLAHSEGLALYLSALEFGLVGALRNFWNIPTATRTELLLAPGPSIGGISRSLLPISLTTSSDVFIMSQLKPGRLSDYLAYIASVSTDSSIVRRSDQVGLTQSTSQLPSTNVAQMITSHAIAVNPSSTVFFVYLPSFPVLIPESRSLGGILAEGIPPATATIGTSSATVVGDDQLGNGTISTAEAGKPTSSLSVQPNIPVTAVVPAWTPCHAPSSHRYPLRVVSTPSTPLLDSINAAVQPSASTDMPATIHPPVTKKLIRRKRVPAEPAKSVKQTPGTDCSDRDLDEEVTEAAEDCDVTLEDVLAAEDEEGPHSTAYREYMAQCVEVYRNTVGDDPEDTAARDDWLSEQRATYGRLWLEHRRATVGGGSQDIPMVVEHATDAFQEHTEAQADATTVEDDEPMAEDEPLAAPQISPREARKLRREQIKEHRNLVKEQRRRAKQQVSTECSVFKRTRSSSRDEERSTSVEYPPPDKQKSQKRTPGRRKRVARELSEAPTGRRARLIAIDAATAVLRSDLSEPLILNAAAGDYGMAPEPDLAGTSVEIPVGEFGPVDVSTEITATKVLRKTGTRGPVRSLTAEERSERQRAYKKKYQAMNSLRRRGLPCDEVAVAEDIERVESIERPRINRSENPQTSLKCSVCGSVARSRKGLRHHLLIRHDQLLRDQPVELFPFEYPCDVCQRTFLTVAALESHKALKHVVNGVRRVFECIICLQVYSNAVQLGVHRRTHMGADGRLPCRFCPDKWFRDFGAAKSHIGNQHADEDQQERAHRAATDGDAPVATPHQCHICHTYFVSNAGVRFHLRKVHKETHNKTTDEASGLLTCDTCQATFKKAGSLINHEKMVHRPPGESPWTCRICNQDCGSSMYLYDHLKSHAVNSEIVCPVCSVSFALKAISEHMRLKHPRRGGRTTCDICGKPVSSSLILEEHKARQHGLVVKKQSCQACGGLIWKDCILKNHYAARHPSLTPAYTPADADFQYKCPSCLGEFTTAARLAQHQRRDHGAKQDKTPRRKAKNDILDDTSEEKYESSSDASS